jgi:hypothetical protein
LYCRDKGSFLKEPRSILAAYQSIYAKYYIISKAKYTRLGIILNEAHYNSRYRAFTKNLLPELLALEYTHLVVETLDYKESLLHVRKYPIIKTGYYSKEPAYGNFLRAAFQLGITVFPYETNRDVTGKEREIDQAAHIKQVMDQNPESNFFIYCGFDHAIEDSTGNA